MVLAFALPARAQNLVDTQWNVRPLSLAVAEDSYGPVKISGMPLPPAADYDIPLVDPKTAVATLKQALILIGQHSPDAVRALARLARHGTPRVVYDAMFPEKQISRVVIAAFMVGQWTPQLGRKDFMVMVGRFGAHWSAEDLAAVLVHELVGHGIQRLEDRFGRDRPIDLECEARLWQQLYYIQSGARLDTNELVSFRDTTNRRVCSDFRRYLSHLEPETLLRWDRGRSDMPHILSLFPAYYAALRKRPPK